MRTKTILFTIIAIFILGMALTACSSKKETQAPANTATQAPANTATVAPAPVTADGETLLNQRCTKCHNLDRVKGAKKTAEQWTATITKMLGKGAKLTKDEQAILVDYLAKTYKP